MTIDSPDGPNALLLFAEGEVGRIEGWFRILGDHIVARGAGVDHLPAPEPGMRIVLILPGTETMIDWLDIPALTYAQAAAAARLALAERSLAPVDELHVAMGDVHGGRRIVAAIDRALMSAWIGWASTAGLDPDSIMPLPLLIAYGDGPPRVWRRPSLVLVRGSDRAFAIEPELLPAMLGESDTEALDDARFEAELPVALMAVPLELRQGPFTRRREWRVDAGWRKRVRRYAIAASALALLIPIARIGRISVDAYRIDREAGRVARLALGRESLPEGPQAALQQRLVALRGPGMGFGPGAAILFAAVRQTPNVELSGLSFDAGGTLTANVSMTADSDLAELVRRIGDSGLAVETLPGGTRTSAVVRVSRS